MTSQAHGLGPVAQNVLRLGILPGGGRVHIRRGGGHPLKAVFQEVQGLAVIQPGLQSLLLSCGVLVATLGRSH